jgi:CheY-like chemotaxis protein
MAYNFNPITVLMVEDNNYISSVLFNVLKALGIGKIIRCRDGKEAIDYLYLLSVAPGGGVIDFVLSDLMMEPVDGLNLLRWIRQHKDSPDRFMPFIMVSGYVDQAILAQSRDLGVTEFLAKPFSVNSVSRKIIAVVEKPRPFIRSETYFGPSRRRGKKVDYAGPERRVEQEADCEVRYD